MKKITSIGYTGVHKSSWIIAIAAVVIMVISNQIFPEYITAIIISILSFIALTTAWNIIAGYTGYFFFGAAAFYGTGAYIGAILMEFMPYYAVILVSASLAFAIACVTGLVFLRVRGAYFAISTLALGELLKNIVFFYEHRVERITGRYLPTQDITTILYYMIAVTLATIIASYLIKNSKFGLGLSTIRNDEDAAEATGVNTTLYKVLAFGICGFFMGATGATFVARLGYIDVWGAFAVHFSVYPVIMGLFGGIGTVPGPIIGAIILRLIFEFFFGTGDPYPFQIALAILLIALVMFLPKGIWGLIRSPMRGRAIGSSLPLRRRSTKLNKIVGLGLRSKVLHELSGE